MSQRTEKPAPDGRRLYSKSRKKRSRGSKIAIAVGIVFLVLVILIVGGGYAALRIITSGSGNLPQLADQKSLASGQTTQIYASDGTILAFIYGDQNRTVVTSQSISGVMKNAIVAIEDQRFYQHHGVDYRGLLRAIWKDILARRAVQGASTITEQLVGNLYLNRSDTSITRKIKEASLAAQYEKKYSKDQILTEYLNTVYFGANAYGVETAAQTYFGKSASDLTLAEAALLAGLPQAPTAYNPRQHPEKALARRNEVLAAMLKQAYITQTEYQQALNTPIKLSTSSPYTKVSDPYVVDYTKQQLTSLFGSDALYKGGLRVETTIAPKYQDLASKSISSVLNKSGDPSAALVSVDPKTGYIEAMVSSSDYDKSKYNLAVQAKRQPGSTFKTFALVAALEQGMDPYTTYYDSKQVDIKVPGSSKLWSVHTFGNKYYGVSSVFQATLRSDNSVYAQLAMDVGARRIVDVAHRMGITSTLNADPAIVLGGLTDGVSPLEMASAYGTLSNQGKHVQTTIISRVWDSSGKLIYQAQPQSTQAISSGVAYVATEILQQNIARGTGTAASIGRAAAGKTGTATDYADAWFCGYTPNLSTVVWMGYPQGHIPMKDVHGISVTGGSFPAKIWQKFMYTADRNYENNGFPNPGNPLQYSPFQSSYSVTTTSATTTTTILGDTTTTTTPAGGTTTTGTTPTSSSSSSTTTTTKH